MQTKSKSRRDLIRAGATIFIGLLILGLFIVALGGHRFWEKYDTYVVQFSSVKDLTKGRPVKYAGIDIGRVQMIEVDAENPGLINVSIGIEAGFALYQGTTARISQKGLVGDNYVFLELTEKKGDRLPKGAKIPAKASPSIAELAGYVGGLIEKLEPKLMRIASGLESFLTEENGDKITESLSKVADFIDTAQKTMAKIDEELMGLTKEAKEGIAAGKKLIANVDSEFTVTIKDVREQVNAVGGSVKNLSDQLHKDLDYDQEQVEIVLRNIRDLSNELKMLSRSLRERPWQVIYPSEKRPN